MKLKQTFLFTSFILSGVALLSLSTVLDSCKSKTNTSYKLTGDTIADGKHLVQLHCTKCHSLVPVNTLTKNVWRMHTLPAMSKYLGISTYGPDFYKDPKDTGGISIVHWQAIVDYYNKLAPDTLMPAKRPVALVKDWAGFSLKKPDRVNDVCFTTMAAASPVTGKIYTGDVVSGKLTEWDKQFTAKTIAELSSPAVNADFVKDAQGVETAIISCIGRIDPVDYPNGRVFSVNLTDSKQQPQQIALDLPRPVQTISADFDKDGKNETVVCGQGHLKGGVYLLKQAADKSYKQFTISERPGAVQAISQDFNKDGYPDIMVLFGSGDEGLTLFLNDKKGGFKSKDLLRFPPVYGSTSFQLTDIDHDGNPDLIYTCGYNFRDSRILKPYHGLYIFKNTGDFNFKQSWFYPINGATKAIAADFDNDGDIDIATIAFFADMKSNPAEEFIYFEQEKAMQFKPHAVPVSQYGRWMTMDVSDLNKDGKPDIILGNYASGFLLQPNFSPSWDEHLPFIVLENHTKK
ncbi:VCBS repeat-containing protein [Mucilaginibacter terrigena]|uniref:VCBS repeat-containing protein n=1 Tax=Mucilaginibacter terrigena TaxID=2492395 RepID=A0A4V1ZC32_9SPHI|nr:VCBS repeat-containing protein [Mucilaginibacter terrigena]RYU91250.1 VCBS repeat-containing protein [Mucilaginibacter terrigena]